jgi:hypothetical protein
MQFTHLRDFFDRTLENLKSIEDAVKNEPQKAPVYEVTQLINSLVLPLELLVNKRFATANRPLKGKVVNKDVTNLRKPLEQLGNEKKAFGVSPEIKTCTNFTPPKNLSEWAVILRNAAAHFNIRFIKAGGKIARIELWAKNHDETEITWRGETSVQGLSTFVRKLLELIKEDELGDIPITDMHE